MNASEMTKVAKRARGLDRAFEMLDFLRNQQTPMRPNEIAVQIKAPRSSVYQIIDLLLKNEILEIVDNDGRVYLGRKLYFLGNAYAEHFDFMTECESALEKVALQTGETSQFCMLDGNKYTVVRMKEGARPFRISSDVGRSVPIPWTASGRLLVSHLSDQNLLEFIPPEDFQLPNGEWLDPKVFIAQVREAAAKGEFTFDSIVDNFTHCFAVPIFNMENNCIATLCLVAPREDGIQNRKKYLDSLKQAAQILSKKSSI